jgi:hypothetical protein
MVTEQFYAPKTAADQQVNNARAQALGNTGAGLISAYEAALPDDAPAAVVTEPADVERFGAALFTWNGGSNFTDNPVVKVQRRVGGDWVDYADQSGELPVTLEFPQGADVPSYLSGDQQWHWTAHFEAFVSQFDTGSGSLATPAGTYRFVVDGSHRDGGAPVPYHLESREFEVRPWSGITIDDVRREEDGTVSFRLGPRSTYTVGGPQSDVAVEGAGQPIEAEIGPIDYPDSYDSPIRFIRDERTAFRDPAAPDGASKLEWYCLDCSFRPWRDAGDAATVTVTIRDAATGAAIDHVPAFPEGDRWRTQRALAPGEVAVVDRGEALDRWEDFNGATSPSVDSNGVVTPPGGDEPAPVGDEPRGDEPPPIAGSPAGACANAVVGTKRAETLRGTAGPDSLRGRGGDDVLRGRGGDDCLAGGRGHDVLRCGPGEDRAVVGHGDRTKACESVLRRD